MDMYIVLGITIFMMAMFIIGKMPYGVITMTCCALLAVTGVMQPAEAFSGLSNSTTLLIAGMLALATASQNQRCGPCAEPAGQGKRKKWSGLSA